MSTLSSRKTGIYDPSAMYSVKNITEEPFTFYWDGRPITLKAGESIKVKEYLAFHATDAMVDDILIKKEKAKLDKIRETKPDYLAPNTAGNLGIPAVRKVWEDQIMTKLPPSNDDDAQLQIIRSEIKAELSKDLSTTASPSISKISDLGVSAKEFEDINMPEGKK